MASRPDWPRTDATGMRPFTVATLAAHWECSTDLIYKLIEDGKLPSFRLGRKLYRIRPADVEAYECQNTELSNTGADLASPTATENGVAFESRLARMNGASQKLALVKSGTPATGQPRNG